MITQEKTDFQGDVFAKQKNPASEGLKKLMNILFSVFPVYIVTKRAHKIETTSIQRLDVESTLNRRFSSCVPAGKSPSCS